MFKRILLLLALICMVVLPVFSQTGNYTTNKYFYLPEYGAYGTDEYNEYNLYMQKADTQIESNKDAIAGIDTSAYYLKTEINTQAKVEAIWGVTLATDIELAALKFTDLDDTPANYTDQAGKYVKVNAGETALEFGTAAGGTVTTSGTPVQYDYARFTDSDTIEGRSYAEVKDDLGYINDLVDDTTPQLGGDLDAQTNHIGFTQQTITYNVTTTTVDWGVGNKATVTLTGNVGTMAFTDPAKPSNLLLKIVQDGTGSRVVTAWDADIKWAGGTAPTLTTTADGIDICSFYWDGTNYFGMASLAFATP